MEIRVIDILAKKHKDWVNMAKSFGLSDDDANEIVQQMYLRITNYVTDPNKIIYKGEEVNTFYVYVTLRNIYLSNGYKPNKRLVYIEDISRDLEIEDETVNVRQKELFDEVIDAVDDIVDSWYWYDKKIFNIHFYEQMSMRKIAKETKISLSSIFNTLSNGKAKIKQEVIKKYEEYLKAKKGV